MPLITYPAALVSEALAARRPVELPSFAVLPDVAAWLGRVPERDQSRLLPFVRVAHSMFEVVKYAPEDTVTHLVVRFMLSAEPSRLDAFLSRVMDKKVVVLCMPFPGTAEILRARLPDVTFVVESADISWHPATRAACRELRLRQAEDGEPDLCMREPPVPEEFALSMPLINRVICLTSGCDCVSEKDNVVCGECGHAVSNGESLCLQCGCGKCHMHTRCGCNAPVLSPEIASGTMVLHQFLLGHRLWQTARTAAFSAHPIDGVPSIHDRWDRTGTNICMTPCSSRIVFQFVPVRCLSDARDLIHKPGMLPVFRTGVLAGTAYLASVVIGHRVQPAASKRSLLKFCIYLQTLRTLCFVCAAQLETKLVIGDMTLSDFVAQHWSNGTVKVRMQLACTGFQPLRSVPTAQMRETVSRTILQLANATAAVSPASASDLHAILAAFVARASYISGELGPDLGGTAFQAIPTSEGTASLSSARREIRTRLCWTMHTVADLLNAPIYIDGVTQSAGAWASTFRCTPREFREIYM